jgi:hypothetical protein
MKEDILSQAFIDKVLSLDNPAKFLAALKVRVANSSAKYIDTPIPFLCQPVFWSKEEIEQLAQAGEKMTSILNKIVATYVNNPDFRKYFNFDPLTEELILVDPGYKDPAPMARYDLFYQPEQKLKFCEFNTDGSSGMNEDNVLAKIFLTTPPLKEINKEYSLFYFELLDSWVEACLKKFWEFIGCKKLPTVAIVDWEGVSTIREFEAFQQAFQAKGCKTVITDPRRLKLKNGKLYWGQLPIDLVYRRLVNHEVVKYQEEITDFIQGYKQQGVCVVGPIRSQIIHNKIIFQVLNAPEVQDLFTDSEKTFITNHIPFTAVLRGDKRLSELAISQKDDLVIKPQDLYGSREVFVGRDYTEDEWLEVLKRVWDKDYLLQEFVVPPQIPMLNMELKVEFWKQILGLYLYNGKMSGLYTRVGKNNVISTSTGGYVVPNLYYEKK